MKIAIASDHAGFAMKQLLRPWLAANGHEIVDLGAHDEKPSDYPDFAQAVAEALIQHRVERGVLLCGSGVGASIAANRFPGVRAALAHDAFSARQAVYDDDANVLCMGPRVIGEETAKLLLTIFLETTFSHLDRHERRLEKLRAIEKTVCRP
ncbi:MAG: ribose 5-phosphate isomerase B [bacterium]|nr:ribose 5-phosphate isomerase B [Candidatus Kapabacteria bacterium]